MGFWNKLFSGKEKTTSTRIKGDFIPFFVKCDKCGEEITVRINRRTDVQNLYADPGDEGGCLHPKKRDIRKEVLPFNEYRNRL